MKSDTLDNQAIDLLRNIPDLVPVYRDYIEDWDIKIFERQAEACRNYLSSNRRTFYKILFIAGGGNGILTIGAKSYRVITSTLFFIHPTDIISWRNLCDHTGGFYCLFKQELLTAFPDFAKLIGRYNVFNNIINENAVELSQKQEEYVNELFLKMKGEEQTQSELRLETLLSYITLVLIEGIKISNRLHPNQISKEHDVILHFFKILEKETAYINFEHPIRIKTVKEFANNLAIHPDYLNKLLKKSTGMNASAHIKNRLLEESKILLLRTNWNISQIGYSIGFDEQSNFNAFFKKNTGFSPRFFRNQQ